MPYSTSIGSQNVTRQDVLSEPRAYITYDTGFISIPSRCFLRFKKSRVCDTAYRAIVGVGRIGPSASPCMVWRVLLLMSQILTEELSSCFAKLFFSPPAQSGRFRLHFLCPNYSSSEGITPGLIENRCGNIMSLPLRGWCVTRANLVMM